MTAIPLPLHIYFEAQSKTPADHCVRIAVTVTDADA